MMDNNTDIHALITKLQNSGGAAMQFEAVECCRRGRQVQGIIARVPGRSAVPVVFPEDVPADVQDAAGWVAQMFKDILAPLPVKPYRKRAKGERESVLGDVVLRAVSTGWSRRNPRFAHFNEAGIVGQFYLPDDQNYLTEDSMNDLGISLDELKIAAAQNTLAQFGIILADTSVLSNDLPEGTVLQSDPLAVVSFHHDGLYWLTNAAPQGGATLMLVPQVMRWLGDLIDSNFYVVPMSTHGILISSKRSEFSPAILKKILIAENQKNTEDDILSTYVYLYDREVNRLKILQS